MSSSSSSREGSVNVGGGMRAPRAIREKENLDGSGSSVSIDLEEKQSRAKKAFETGDAASSITLHDAKVSLAKEKHKKGGDFLKSIIYGGVDGIITTFAVVAGAAGGNLGASVVLVMGFANLIADGLSMGLADWISSKAEMDYSIAEKRRETWEYENYAEGEKKEMREIYVERGMTPADAAALIDLLAQYKEIFINTMMVEELGIMPPDLSAKPHLNGLVTFGSFALAGLIPLIAYVIGEAFNPSETILFAVACVMTAISLFILGALTARFTIMTWWQSGLFYLAVGACAAAASYLVGWGISHVVDTSAKKPAACVPCNCSFSPFPSPAPTPSA